MTARTSFPASGGNRLPGYSTPDAGALLHGHKEKIPFPVSPVIHSALRAIYAGGPKLKWQADRNGRPFYSYVTKAGDITFFCEPPPDYSRRFHPTIAMYYTPRLGFIYAGSLRDKVRNLSVETADVLLILMSYVARLADPRTGIARITLEEMAAMRDVHLRRGRSQNLYAALKEEVLRIADLRLSMTWKDYRTGGGVAFGKERPDRLLDILDVEYEQQDRPGTAFRFRCGQALSHFLDAAGLFWIGYYSRSLLHLSPYHEVFTKKVGTYWTLIGTIAGKKGGLPRATPRTILDFCGDDVHGRNPGYTVDAFFKAHERLREIGVIADDDLREPVSRTRGYMQAWLEDPITVRLSERLWKPAPRLHERKPSRSDRRFPFRSQEFRDREEVPRDVAALWADPMVLKRLRARFYLRQEDLSRAVGISRQTLSRYERGICGIPPACADKILTFLHKKVGRDWEQ